ncbi:MAG: RNA polymerase subunit sigma-70, partial [Muribaculaceae bacterium]|nr:RNA polymerase subunit sigma-70 [Muribaculaceae bacterium]
GGGALDVPVFGNQWIREHLPQTDITESYTLRVKAPLQWSVEGGFGIQYNITPSLSIYAEPSFRYWLNSGSDVKTIHKEQAVEFSLPIGLRLTW